MTLVVVPYLAASDALSPRRAVARMLGRSLAVEPSEASAAAAAPKTPRKAAARWRTSNGQRMAFEKKDSQASLRFQGYGAALREMARELPKAFHYGVGGLALIGIWKVRRQPWRPCGVLALCFVLIYVAAAVHVAARSGYLAPRHLLPLVVVALAWAAEGAFRSAEYGVRGAGYGVPSMSSEERKQHAGWFARTTLRWHSALRTPHSALRAQSALTPLVVLLAAAACLPRTLAPLHASRLGHRDAARWLALQGEPDGTVLDTRGFTRFFSGRKTYDFEQGRLALRDPRLAYVVVERRELEYDSQRGRTLRELLSRGAVCVARFAADASHAETVEVYRWPRSRAGTSARPANPSRQTERTEASALSIAVVH
jgi:hypothetical protein